MSLILVSEKDNHVQITLNRPSALNALNHDMILKITSVLNDYAKREDIKSIIFKGAGDRAFCAGGDVKAIYYAGHENPMLARQYFGDEYKMNALIHGYPKPVISLCHGYVMGGGYGIAGNGSEIIVDDTTRFAMPETAIGFFPDVGIGWRLAKAGALGMYMALTGLVFDSDMMMVSGMASRKVQDVNATELVDVDIDSDGIENLDEIQDLFSGECLGDIWEALERTPTKFVKETLEVLKSRSPLSLHITFSHIKKAKNETYHESIDRDYRLACAFIGGHDLYEGIRAQLIDRDKSPKWQSSSIFNISLADIDYYMQFSDDVNH